MVRRGYKFLHTSKIQGKFSYTIVAPKVNIFVDSISLLVDFTRLSELLEYQLLKSL